MVDWLVWGFGYFGLVVGFLDLRFLLLVRLVLLVLCFG